MATRISFTAQPRDTSLKPKALRRTQVIPSIIYGRGFASKSLQCDYLSIVRVVRQAGMSRLISLSIEGEGEAHNVLIREVQRDPVTDSIMHVDFYRVLAGKQIRIEIPLVARGEAPVTDLGGIVNQLLNVLEIECLPKDMPGTVEFDLGQLTDFSSHITVADLAIPEDVEVLTPPEIEVVRVLLPRMEVEEEIAVEEVAEEGEAETPEESAAASEEQQES